MDWYYKLEDFKDYKLVRDFMTNQCNVMVFDTGIDVFDERIYAVASRHLNNHRVNIRFGTKLQVKSIICCYRIEKEFEV